MCVATIKLSRTYTRQRGLPASYRGHLLVVCEKAGVSIERLIIANVSLQCMYLSGGLSNESKSMLSSPSQKLLCFNLMSFLNLIETQSTGDMEQACKS